MYAHDQNGREEIERSCQCTHMIRMGGRRLKDHVNVSTWSEWEGGEIERSCQCTHMIRMGGRRLKDHVNVRT